MLASHRLAQPPCRMAGQQLRVIHQVKFSPLREKKDLTHVPFKVSRTPSGNLPVYAKIRHHGTNVTTVLRRFLGDVAVAKRELRIVCEAPARSRAGKLEVKGLHVEKIKGWLVSLGF
eukprot:TRINITY_DN128933_c0_g1_i2.p1 TRINITY_DN128933_c0_g1~~TRINITY_DN128933_c0_g1_i2.p1  ORF type:complete len:117 (+),score=4.08 TRINITY_DN128933_c0_g1_i2:116-466(+)